MIKSKRVGGIQYKLYLKLDRTPKLSFPISLIKKVINLNTFLFRPFPNIARERFY